MASASSRNQDGGASAARARDSRRRHDILRAAQRLFEHYGFVKTTVADIARKASVGVGTVYLEFSSKDAIVAALAIERYDRVLEAMRQAAASGASAAERLCALFDVRMDRLVAIALEGPHSRELVQSCCAGAAAAHQRFRAAEEDLVTEVLDAARNSGELAVVEPRTTARVLIRIHASYSALLASSAAAHTLRKESERSDAPERPEHTLRKDGESPDTADFPDENAVRQEIACMRSLLLHGLLPRPGS